MTWNGGVAGWCYDEQECYSRSKMALGSSKGWSKTGGCGCMNTKDDGLDEDCNCLYMPYGDGASFSGFRPDPWPVPGTKTAEKPEGEVLYFRGIKNIDATVDWAMEHGLKTATEFVLTGGSAGGLSTFLHADRVAARVEAEAPGCKKIRAAPVVGYFLDHDNYAHDSASAVPNTPSWNHANYTTWMRYIYKMQNLTFGSDGGLTKACEEKHPEEPGLCFMSPHMQDVIKTPFFSKSVCSRTRVHGLLMRSSLYALLQCSTANTTPGNWAVNSSRTGRPRPSKMASFSMGRTSWRSSRPSTPAARPRTVA